MRPTWAAIPRSSLGDLGGPFAWYYMMGESRGGSRFISWMWSDAGTARMLGQVFRGNAPTTYNIYRIAPGIEVAGFGWREIRGSLIMGAPTQHVAWAYTSGLGANEISRQLQSEQQGKMCKKYGTCTLVRNTQGMTV